jgi:hypothetical protein
VDAVLIAVAHIANINLGRGEINDVAGGLTVLEQQVAQGAIAQCGSEIVLLSNGWSFDHHAAGTGTISQQHLLGAVDQIAVHQGVADIKGHRLQAAGVGQ